MTDSLEEQARRVGGLAAIVGDALSSDVGNLLAAHAQRRNLALLRAVAEVVDGLTEHVEGLTVEAIVTDPRFLATTEKVIRAAQQSSDDEHRARLVRALRHAGAWSVQEHYATERMTDLLTRLGPLHLFLTRVFAYPAMWLKNNVAEFATSDEAAAYGTAWDGHNLGMVFGLYVFPGNKVPPGEVARVIEELQREGIMEGTRADGFGLLNTAMSQHEMLKPRLTGFGNTFLAFAEDDLAP